VLQDAIRAYHDLLTDDLAAASQEQLDGQQRRRGLSFGDRLLCTVLRPRFLTPDQYRFLRSRVHVLMRAFTKTHEAALAAPAFRRQYRLLDGEEALLRHDPRFRCKVLYKKASLAVLSDERNARLFGPEEQQAIAAHVPWTRVVEERRTEWEGRPIDLIPFVLGHREGLVLKPNDDYGGKGIVLGWTVDAARWEQAVQTALAEPYVVQERVTLPHEPFPSLVDGRVRITERMLDTAPFVCQGEYVDGCLTRIATDPLLNVSAGGGSTVPTFLVEPR